MESARLNLLLACICLAISFATAGDNTYTKEEISGARKVRPLIKNIVYEDWMMYDDFIIPFLRARKGDPGRTKEMIEKVSLFLTKCSSEESFIKNPI